MSVAALRLSVIGATFCALAAADVASAQTFSSEQHEIRVVKVARGLVHPWSLAFLPNGDMLVTERVNRLRIIRNEELSSSPVPGVPEVALGGQGGQVLISEMACGSGAQRASDEPKARDGQTFGTNIGRSWPVCPEACNSGTGVLLTADGGE